MLSSSERTIRDAPAWISPPLFFCSLGASDEGADFRVRPPFFCSRLGHSHGASVGSAEQTFDEASQEARRRQEAPSQARSSFQIQDCPQQRHEAVGYSTQSVVPDGPERIRLFLVLLKDSFPNNRSEIKRVFANGDYVIVHVHAVR